jgi:glycosyltransferase involved in cell wall biosynthesis
VNTEPLITVYIPCRNYGRFLGNAIESVEGQLYKNWELFIIDEASSDETPVIANQYRSEKPQKIIVLRHEMPLGLQKIANKILSLANGRYIVRLDADDWFEESALLLMAAKLESDSKLGLVYGNYFYTDPDGQVIGIERRRKIGVEDASGHLPPHGACTMVRTRMLKAVGGYSEDVNAQDGWELWFKFVNRVKVASLEAPLFYYRQHDKSLSRDSDKLLTARANIIAKTRSKLEGNYIPSCLAVIPIKESYPDFQGVPFRMIGKRSMLQSALDSAQGANGVTEVAVTSDSNKVIEFSRELYESGKVKKHMQVERPKELSGSHIRLRDILLHASEAYKDKYQSYPDIVLFLSLHAPLRKPEHVDNAIDVLRINTCDSVVSVIKEREPLFVHDRKGLKLLNSGRFDGLMYEREIIYRFNGAVIAVWWEVLKDSDMFGENIGYIRMGYEDSVQVKNLQDFKKIQLILNNESSQSSEK